jgi:hypothetical protein
MRKKNIPNRCLPENAPFPVCIFGPFYPKTKWIAPEPVKNEFKENEYFDVERFVKRRKVGRKDEILVKFTGYDEMDWVGAKQLRGDLGRRQYTIFAKECNK